MSDRTDPAWDEYLSTGEDPTGGELEAADEENATDEMTPGEWQPYSRQIGNKPYVRKTFSKAGCENLCDMLVLLAMILFVVVCIGTCS